MWELLSQVKRLLEKTGMTLSELSDALAELGLTADRTEISRAFNGARSTAKSREIISASHKVLTERLEEINEEKAAMIKRGRKALEKAQELDSTGK